MNSDRAAFMKALEDKYNVEDLNKTEIEVAWEMWQAAQQSSLLREAVGLLTRVRQVHTGDARSLASVEKSVKQAVKDFLVIHEQEVLGRTLSR